MSDRCRLVVTEEGPDIGVVNRLGNYLISTEGSELWEIDKETFAVAQTIDVSSLGLFRLFDADTLHYYRVWGSVIYKIQRSDLSVVASLDVADDITALNAAAAGVQVVKNIFLTDTDIYCVVQYHDGAWKSRPALRIDKDTMQVQAIADEAAGYTDALALLGTTLYYYQYAGTVTGLLNADTLASEGTWTTTQLPGSGMCFDGSGKQWAAQGDYIYRMIGPADFTQEAVTPYRSPRSVAVPAYHSGDDRILATGIYYQSGYRKFFVYGASDPNGTLAAVHASADMGVQLSWGIIDSL